MKLFIYFLLLFVYALPVFSNNLKGEDDFTKAKSYLRRGDYDLAIEKLNSIIKENQDKDLIKLRASSIKAQVFCLTGNFKEYKSESDKVFSFIQSNPNTEPILILELLETYLAYGDIKKSYWLTQHYTSQLFNNKGNITSLQFTYYNAVIEQRSGNINEALNIINTLTSPIEKLILNNKEELKQLLKFKLDIINFKALCLIENNSFYDANELLIQNYTWAKENLSGDEKITDILYFSGMLHYKKGNYQEAVSYLQKAESSCGLNYFPHTENYIQIQELLIPALKKVDKNKEAQTKNELLDAQVRIFFGKENFYTYRNSLIDAQRNMMNGDWSSASKLFKEFLSDTIIVPTDHPLRGSIYEQLYQALAEGNNLQEAEIILNKFVLFQQENYIPNSTNFHLAKLQQANYFVLTETQLKTIEQIYNYSLDSIISKNISIENFNRRRCETERISLYLAKEDFKKATYYSKLLKEKIENALGNQHIGFAMALQNQARVDITLGIFNQAGESLNKALQIIQKETSNESEYLLAKTAVTQIHYLIMSGRYNEASSWSKKLKRLNNSLNVSILNNEYYEALSLLYIHEGKIIQTEKYLLNLIHFREDKFGRTHRSLIEPYYLLSKIYISKGDIANAELNLNKGLDLALKCDGNQSSKYANGIEIQGKIYSTFGYYEKAEKELVNAITIKSKLYNPDNFYVVLLKNELALVYVFLKRNPKTIESLFDETLVLIEKQLGKQNPSYANVLKNKAIFYLYTSSPNKSIPLIEQAINISSDPTSKAELIWIRGKSEALLGDYSKANLSFQTAKESYFVLYGNNHPSYIKCLGACSQMNYNLGDTKKSIAQSEETIKKTLLYIDKIFPSLTEMGKSNYWESVKDDIEFYKNLAIKYHKEYPYLLNDLYTIQLKTKSILLNSSQKLRNQIVQSKDSLLLRNYERWMEAKENLAAAYDIDLTRRKELNINIDVLEKNIDELEKIISTKSGINHRELSTKNFDIEQLKKNLAANTLAIEIVTVKLYTNHFTDTTWYIYLTINNDPNTPPQISISQNGNRMETSNLKYYRNCVKYKIRDSISYAIYWQPIETNITKSYDKIYLSGDGVYNLINPETLINADDSYVFDKYNLIPINSTRELINLPTQAVRQKTDTKPENSIFIVGNPQYYNTSTDNGKIASLPGTEKEVNQISTIVAKSNWNVKIVTNDQATEESIKNMDQRKIIHIATHGFFLNYSQDNSNFSIPINKAYENPLLRCGILLKDGGHLMESTDGLELNKHDGVLTAYEASNLSLYNTELVVLSACETGLGDVKQGEGVYGLQRSFMLAGAKTMVISLFKVSDEVTQELMTQFYTYWIQTNNKRAAFNKAKREIKSKYPDPINWGAFIMIGE